MQTVTPRTQNSESSNTDMDEVEYRLCKSPCLTTRNFTEFLQSKALQKEKAMIRQEALELSETTVKRPKIVSRMKRLQHPSTGRSNF
jgi:hypothetical protein